MSWDKREVVRMGMELRSCDECKHKHDNWVRLGDYPVGLFTFNGKLYTKVSQEVVVRITTGNVEPLHPDILVWPIKIEEGD